VMHVHDRAEVIVDGKWATVEWRDAWDTGGPCVVTQRVPTRPHRCWKCRDGRTRAHHRLCWRRGGKRGFQRAAQAEMLAAYRGEPSPMLLPWRLSVQAATTGRAAAGSVRLTEERIRGLSIASMTFDELTELATILDVDADHSTPAVL